VLTVTAGNATRSYGTANPAFSYSITGFVNNDPTSVVNGTPALNTTATASSAPGSYTITADVSSLSAGNYTFSPVKGRLTVAPAPLSAAAVNFSTTAGAPFSGTVATFTNADPYGTAASYIAFITWGDGSTSAGTISGTGSTLTVSGSHTYAAAGTPGVSVVIGHIHGYTMKATTSGTASVGSLSAGVVQGMTGTTAFWQTTGQALIKSFNGGSTATALSAWLAANFPNLYAAGGVHNLAGKTNAEVAAYFQSLFQLGSTQVQVEVLAVALNVYATTSSLGGTVGQPYGFFVSATGLGARSFSVLHMGAAFGVANGTVLNVYQLLRAVNQQAPNGVLYKGDATLQAQAADLFNFLNQVGSVT
jgi:hypothetical protein